MKDEKVERWNGSALMISAGYMAKNVVLKPDWLNTDRVVDIYSISGCMSEPFTDYIQFWKHNGYWLFDSPEIILNLTVQNKINLSDAKLFFYEVYGLEYDEKKREFRPFKPCDSFITNVVEPGSSKLEGFDIASFWAGNEPECSPLSCNGLAESIRTNKHCLLDSLEEAIKLLEDGSFDNTEPGPFRIFSIYSVEWSPHQPI